MEVKGFHSVPPLGVRPIAVGQPKIVAPLANSASVTLKWSDSLSESAFFQKVTLRRICGEIR